ncbi:MAG: hypothetical protein ACRCZ0_06215 [Cetobacterium sp.]
MSKYYKFIGFGCVNEDVKPIYFDKETRKYKTLVTKKGIMKDKKTGEKIETFNGTKWVFLNEDEIEIVS